MSFMLAEKDEARADIVISVEAGRVARFAAKELSSYLRKISGSEFRVREVRALQENALRIVDSDWTDDAAAVPTVAADGRDAFAVDVDANGVAISGANGRSVLYGAYEFLERLGCQFLEPETEIVPKRNRLEAPPMNVKSTASFAMRNIFRVQIMKSKTADFLGLEPEHHLPQIAWMAKRKLNQYIFYVDYYRYDLWEKHKHHVLDALLDRGFDIEVTHHSVYYFCPPDEIHDYGDWGPSTYRSAHPEWYEGDQLNIGLPDVQNLLEERYMTFVRRNPEVSRIGLWPTDGGMVGGSEAYLKLWNKIAPTLANEFPEKKLSILAYLEILEPPKGLRPEPNLFCWYCPIRSNYNYTMTEDGNEQYLPPMKGWIDLMPPDQVICFEYFGWQAELTPFTHKIKADLGVYHDMGLGGVNGWAGFTFNIMGTNYRWARALYAFSNLLWDVKTDVVTLESEWTEGVFGYAAPQIQEFYQALTTIHSEEKKLGLVSQKPWISIERLHELQKILGEARNRTESQNVARRVNLLEQLAGRACAADIWREQPSGVYSCF